MATIDIHGLEPLLHRAMAGDGRALNDLLTRLRPYLYTKVREQLGDVPDGRIEQSAIVGSVCRRFLTHFPELEDPSAPLLLGWVAAIVRNRVADELRRLARQPALLGSAVVSVRDPRPTAESQARAEVAAEVAAALARLPARERRVVETKWFDPQPDEETAQELGITVNYVRQLRFRALEKLREMLAHSAEVSR
jgi:RNA polymerase sigma-70 factor (ECF subfamily)